MSFRSVVGAVVSAPGFVRAWLAFGVMFLVAACGGSSSQGGEDPVGGGPGTDPGTDPGDNPPACVANLSATSGQALDFLGISGLPEEFMAQVADPDQPMFAEVYRRGTTSADDVLLTLLPLHVEGDIADAPSLLLPLPFDPDVPFETVELGFAVVAGTERCELPSVVIAGLPAVADPVAVLAELDESMMALLSGYAVGYGIFGWDNLVAAVEAFDPDADLPMGLVAVLLGTDAHLQAQGILAASEPAELAVYASMVTEQDLAASLRDRAELLEFYARSAPLASRLASYGMVGSGGKAHWGQHTMILAAQPSSSGGLCAQFPGDRVSISSPEDLDYYMRLQQIAENSLDSTLRTLATGFLPMIPGAVGNVAGLVAFVESLVTARDVYQLPNRFTLLELNLDPGTNIPEDYEEAGKTPRWHDARANAASQQWVLDASILDALSELVSTGRWVKGVRDANSAEALVDLNRWITESMQGTLVNYGQFNVFALLKQRVDGAECFVMQPNSWSGIDVTHEDYTLAEVAGDSIELLKSGNQYTRIKLLDIGTSLIDLSIRNDNDRWGGWRALSGSQQFGGRTRQASEPVNVQPINVRFVPLLNRVQELGEIVTLRIRVSDSELAAEVNPIIMLGAGASIVSGPDLESLVAPRTADYLLDVLTPLDSELYPVLAQAWRVSPLPPGAVRDGEGEIDFRETIELTPRNACVEPDEVLTLTAELSGFSASTVLDWAVESPATLSNFVNSGLTRKADFSSSQRGNFLVQVSAPSVIDPGEEVTDAVNVAVGNCTPVHLWGALTTFAEAGVVEDRYESEPLGIFPEAPFPPARHTDFWMGRDFELIEAVQATGVVNGRTVSAAATTQARWEADSDGAVTMRHLVSPSSNECVPPTEEEGEVECSEALSLMLGAAVFYVDVDAPRTVRVQIEGSCDLSGSLAGGLGVAGGAWRMPADGASVDDHVAPNGPYSEDHVPENFISPFFISVASEFMPPDEDTVGNICASAYGGRWSYEREFELDGPIVPGTTDLVTFTIGVGSTTVLDYGALSLVEQIGLGFRPNPSGGVGLVPLPLGFATALGPVEGTYEGTAQTEVRIIVE